jgi:hypothetical protein
MSTRHYALPVEQTKWSMEGGSRVVFNWEYDEGRDRLLTLYEKGKTLQWNANQRIDWSHELDPDNPLGIPDEHVSLYGSDLWAGFGPADKAMVRRHIAAWQFSQFLHGEQGALICTARIVESVPQIDAKFYAATQVMDEARHVEVFSRLLNDKIGLAYPVNPHLKALLQQVLTDSRWDMVYLGMQVLIEGLALAAFASLRDFAADPLIRAVNAYVMQDEARHVAFGRLALRDYYPELTAAERAEREEFVVEASYLMRDRFLAEEMWDTLGFDRAECLAVVDRSLTMREYRKMLFSRIVPTVKDIGLWGPKVQGAFRAMGVLAFGALNPDDLGAADELIGRQLDLGRADQARDRQQAKPLDRAG